MFKCDVCGQDIKSIGDGLIESISPDDPRTSEEEHDLRVVHAAPASPRAQSGCQRQGVVFDMPLSDCVGDDGLTYLLSMLSEGRAQQAEVLELIKRLHTPYYEEARPHLAAALAQGIIEPNLYDGFYSQGDLITVLEHFTERPPPPAVTPRA